MKCLMIYITNPMILNISDHSFMKKGDHFCNVQGLKPNGIQNIGILVIKNNDNVDMCKFYPNDKTSKPIEFQSIRDAIYEIPKLYGVKGII